MKKKQPELILEYIQEYGSITPAKVSNSAYNGGWFGAEVSRACRNLRSKGKLISENDGKYEVFKLSPLSKLIKENTPTKEQLHKEEQPTLFKYEPTYKPSLSIRD